MPAGLDATEEKAWRRAKRLVRKQRGRRLSKSDWPLVMHITKQIAKSATAVEVQPYKKVVMDAINLVEQLNGSGFFAGITKVVLEPGDPGHFGLSRSDETDTVYVSSDKISAVSGGSRHEEVVQVAMTLVHEVAHIRANFLGGEAPAMAAERDLQAKLSAELAKNPAMLDKYARRQARADMVVLAHGLDTLGLEAAADLVTQAAFSESYIDPHQLSVAVASLISASIGAVSPQNRSAYRQSMIKKLHELRAEGLSARRRNPSAAIGAMSGLLKNLLGGQSPSTVDFILSEIVGKV